jgi:glutamate formiminotransferase / formiminotetrahydrofolate cyclodeaminase
MKLVECVPNFSEGRDREVIDAIAGAISSAQGVTLLDVDPGADTNRTVMTFLGHPEAVAQGAFRGIEMAAKRIDMRRHQGAHARLGATDVCPFVPVRDVSMEECVMLARGLAEWVSGELGIPVYLYEEAATRAKWRNLAEVRKGEYESLPGRLTDPRWQPDFGNLERCEQTGATVIGAREFLIAYNFNLNTRDRKIAHDIALDIREAGRARRDKNGKILRTKSGKARKKAGKFKHVKAVGWTMEEFHCAQISMNLTNFKKTPLAEVFDEVCRQAELRGVRCTGSELVGLVPKECLLGAGRHYLHKAGKSAGVPEPEILRLAVQSLGLNDLYPFDLSKKIIDFRIPDPRPLVDGPVRRFADELSTDSPAPGGGSVSALCGAMGAALACMVGQLTADKKGYEKVSGAMKKMCEETQVLKDRLIRSVDDDTAAFNRVMDAFRLPRKTAEQKTDRNKAIQEATKLATEVPLEVMRTVQEVVDQIDLAIQKGNRNSLSDAGVAGLCARTAAEGAFYNVQINLADIRDKSFVRSVRTESERLLTEIRKKTDGFSTQVSKTLKQAIKT